MVYTYYYQKGIRVRDYQIYKLRMHELWVDTIWSGVTSAFDDFLSFILGIILIFPFFLTLPFAVLETVLTFLFLPFLYVPILNIPFRFVIQLIRSTRFAFGFITLEDRID